MRTAGFVGLAFLLIGAAIEIGYRHLFQARLRRLREDVEAVHPNHAMRYDFMRLGRESQGAHVSWLVDTVEAMRLRAGGGRLSGGSPGYPWTHGYFSVHCSGEVNGELRTVHVFIWSPRSRTFHSLYGFCDLEGCPAAR